VARQSPLLLPPPPPTYLLPLLLVFRTSTEQASILTLVARCLKHLDAAAMNIIKTASFKALQGNTHAIWRCYRGADKSLAPTYFPFNCFFSPGNRW
jgi:hypothetical protein